MTEMVKRVLRIAGGIGLILLGIAGLILPLMPGVIFIFAGIMLLGPNTRVARWLTRALHRLREKFRRRSGSNRRQS